MTIPALRGTGNARHAVQHECGHAAAFWALGIPFSHIDLIGAAGPAVHPVSGTRMQQGHDFVIKACGAIADYQARGLRIRGGQIVKLILGGDDDIFELDDAATGQVSVRPSRVPAVQPGGDLQNMAALFTGMPRAQAVPEIIRFWRECERFARKLQPAIDALAEVLFACGRLSYSEASDIAAGAMADRPIPVLAEWLR